MEVKPVIGFSRIIIKTTLKRMESRHPSITPFFQSTPHTHIVRTVQMTVR